jgi:Fic-DOC domain mobile mystery protein B
VGSAVALVFVHGPDQTPIDADEKAGLLPQHLATMGQLDEWEATNILEAMKWLNARRKLNVLNEAFCRQLHKKMFDKTWKWAGEFRRSDKNIGGDWRQGAVGLKQLLENVDYWITESTFPLEEIAVRFHHALVLIHPFPNGNGRHSRAMTDALLRQMGLPAFTWGSGQNLVAASETRTQYIAALRAADSGDFTLLQLFVRS